MLQTNTRRHAKNQAIHRTHRKIKRPEESGKRLTEYYGENSFDLFKTDLVTPDVKKIVWKAQQEGTSLPKEIIGVIAKAVTDWSLMKGVTHFCHWFQPLTGATAEKHDAFLTFKYDEYTSYPIEKLTSTQLTQGEPDASSFPNGGSRTTFEARGYTSWDFSSPFFIMEGLNGKTLCIPTAFVSYHGEALDVKTPLLRSIDRLNKVSTEFLQVTGSKDVTSVKVTCGCEQEYFLIDKSFYYLRPDLPMTGRTLLGSMTAKNQQLDDHYFGTIDDRVQNFMQEFEFELYRLGIPAKTRHNEVAPGQFEIAPIFEEANISNDHNQVLMALLKSIARKHDFVAVLHEKPFAGINGSGKHTNWSLADNLGNNLLEPGENPQDNYRFLAVVAIITEAVHRHAAALRMAIAAHGNDHRLGANEAPPSIISVFLGETLDGIFKSIASGATFKPLEQNSLDLGANQLMNLFKDNTDRNRTSPFAFTGNKFEFRAVGSTTNVGWPLTILNSAVAEVFAEANTLLKAEIDGGSDISTALEKVTKKFVENSSKVVFNGDGYGQAWVEEAAKRGLPNLRTTSDALAVLRDEKLCQFLTEQNILTQSEIETRHNVLIEQYSTCRQIEFSTLENLVNQYVIPAAVAYKTQLVESIQGQKEVGIEAKVETQILNNLATNLEALYQGVNELKTQVEGLGEDEVANSQKIANELLPLSEKIAANSDELEAIIPDNLWDLPKFYDMLFVR